MNNVFNILDARMDKCLRKFTDGLDSAHESTIAKYSAACGDPRVSHVLDSLFDIVQSRSETRTNLILRGQERKVMKNSPQYKLSWTPFQRPLSRRFSRRSKA
jgi:hypothetical protein